MENKNPDPNETMNYLCSEEFKEMKDEFPVPMDTVYDKDGQRINEKKISP
ncbi:MAG: hypothetical protein GX640_04070 [Fibrobacter sp.]|nr:hypothetical protein [Fibrobacter sp.]